MSDNGLPKYLVLAQSIEASVTDRRLAGGRMPSVREIAAEHGVSVVTAARAVQVLRDKGLVSSVERSGSFVAAPESADVERWAIYLRATPGPWQQASGTVGRRGFEMAARQQGHTLFTELFSFVDETPAREVKRQVRAARDAGAAGVFYMPSRTTDAGRATDEAFLEACGVANLAVVLVERNLRGGDATLSHDLVCSDDVAGGACCTRHLLDAGCRRVALVIASPTSTHNDRLAGYLYALFTAGQPCQPLVFHQATDRPGKEAYGLLAEQLLAARVDGVICYQDYTAVGLILEFLARGVAVPNDIAIAGFDDLPVGNLFAIGVTTYAYPSEGIAREALRVMRRRVANPEEKPVKVVVPGNLIVRESSARVKVGKS